MQLRKARLTPNEQEILKHIESLTGPTTLQEVADCFDRSLSWANKHVSALRRKGYLFESDGNARGVRAIPAWHEVPACMHAMLGWMADVGLIDTAAEAVAVLKAPTKHTQAWEDFCNESPGIVKRLRKKHLWRSV